MIAVNVRINNEHEVASLSATRTHPKTCDVEEGTECTYTLKYHNTPVGTMTNSFGCGIDLAKAMLDWFKEHKNEIKTTHMIMKIKEIDDANERSEAYGGIVPGRIQSSKS